MTDEIAIVLLILISKASIGEDGVLVSATPSIYIKEKKEKPNFIRMWMREISRYAKNFLILFFFFL